MRRPALMMCRVSDASQKDGQSLPSQEKFGDRYAEQNSLDVVKRWVLDEKASDPNERKAFNEMLDYRRRHPEIKDLLFEKPDRFTRNVYDLAKGHELIFKDGVTLHFFKTKKVINKSSPYDDLSHFNSDCIQAVNFINILKQETEKGVAEKIEQGWFPGLAPCGYKNVTIKEDGVEKKIIEMVEDTARWPRRAFELERTGLYTLESCRAKLLKEGCPDRLLPHESTLEKWLKNVFYYGDFIWKGVQYRGAHPALVSKRTWDEANAALSGGGKTLTKRGHPYQKMFHCFYCQCMVTAEGHDNGKNIYYRCAWSKGKCGNVDYVRQEVIEQEMHRIMTAVQVDAEFADWTLGALAFDAGESTTRKISEMAVLKQQLQKVIRRIEVVYDDKLDGKISEEEWTARNNRYLDERRALEERIAHLEVSSPSSYLSTARRILELSKVLPQLFFSLKPENRRQLFRVVSLNTTLKGKTLTTTYQTPWSFLAERPGNQIWGE